jgi:hypothetical protein
MARKKTPTEFYILTGYSAPRAVFHTLEDLVTWADANPHPYSGDVLRYVEGEKEARSIGSFSRIKVELEAAEAKDEEAATE